MLVIDGALNCSYCIFAVEDADFAMIFPMSGQDIEFIEDVVDRLGEDVAGGLVMRTTSPAKRVEKAKVRGIHGTLFFQLPEKKVYYPTKRETDLDKNRSRW